MNQVIGSHGHMTMQYTTLGMVQRLSETCVLKPKSPGWAGHLSVFR
jgi:hypothetical protein